MELWSLTQCLHRRRRLENRTCFKIENNASSFLLAKIRSLSKFDWIANKNLDLVLDIN